MLFGLIIFLFTVICAVLTLIVLIQKGGNSMGMGSMGGKQVMLFGGSGGQDVFQKITWVLGALFLGGSLALSILKTEQVRGARYLTTLTPKPVQEQPLPQG